MPLKHRMLLRLALVRLRLGSWWTSKRLAYIQAGLNRAAGGEKPLKRWPYVAVLVLCLAVAVSAVVVSALAQGAPVLRTLDGSPPGADEVVILDPYRRDETMLAPGTLYERPVAAVQTGAAPILLRMRLEETLLTAARDGEGRAVETRPLRAPGENDEPRTVSQEEAFRRLTGAGIKADSWEDALKQKLPARRLPNGDNDGGRILVFEKKTVIADADADIPGLAMLPPEVIEQYDLGSVFYTYIGFYYIYEGGAHSYQPLHIAVDDPAPRRAAERPPAITELAGEFYPWEMAQERVYSFSEDQPASVNLQPGDLRPVEAWTGPEDAWFYDADGWVYYGQALAPGVMTPLLLRSFTVWPESPLVREEETRYRLVVRAQKAPLVHRSILEIWNSGAPLGDLGSSRMTGEAADALFGRVYPRESGVINYVYENE